MFGFRVTYLRGSVTAADVRSGHDKDLVEWPPHPDRLFCALVQAWGDLGESERGAQALRWLEQLHHNSPPLIRCGQTLNSTSVQRFVPVNDRWDPLIKKGAEKGAQPAPLIAGTLLGRLRQPRRIPAAPLTDDSALFWWPDANPPPEVRAALAALAAAVASLGHSSSLVAVEVLDDLPSTVPTWVPRSDGDETLRIPTPGRLQLLADAYRARPRRRPPPGHWVTYGPPVSHPEVPCGLHRDLIVFRLIGDRPPLPLESAAKVIAVWRAALLSKADQPVCEALSGHAPGSTLEAPLPTQNPHLALVPLPDVGHRFARSHLLGLAAALPARLSPDERRACLRALARVDSLTLGALGLWRLARCDAAETRRALLPETWCRPALVWASVTPLVFGRYPKDLWGEQAAHMVRDACLIAGLPLPSHVATAPVAWVLGVPPAQRFPPLPTRSGKPRRAHAHVRLVFPSPVAGPLLVGAGRHLGYGLFRQLPGESQ